MSGPTPEQMSGENKLFREVLREMTLATKHLRRARQLLEGRKQQS
jgi:hypothetical protein